MTDNLAADNFLRSSNPCRRVFGGSFHVMLKRITHVAGNINGLNFQRAEIINFTRLVVGAKNDVNISSRATVGVFQADFRERRPSRIRWKKEIRRIVCNHPALAETNRASDDNFIILKHAAYTKRVLRFVFRAVRNFIVEWAKTFCSMAVALALMSVAGNPKTSASGCFILIRNADKASRWV